MLRRLQYGDKKDAEAMKKDRQRKAMELFRLIDKCKWDKVKRFIKSNKNNLSEIVDPSGLSPLSLAVSSNAPLSIIREIIIADPQGATKTDNFGATPLHLACLNGTTPDIIRLILDSDGGKSARAVDRDDYTVLHHAVEYVCLLIERRYTSKNQMYSSSLESSDSIRSEHEDYLEIIKQLCRTAPEMVNKVTKDSGDTPLDIPQIIMMKNSGARFERDARLAEVYRLLRETSIYVYRTKKKQWEIEGSISRKPESEDTTMACENSLPSLTSSSLASSALSNLRESKISSINVEDDDHMSIG
jgi:hypothetical protein